MGKTALQLDRSKASPLFDKWKLAKGLAVSQSVVTLEGPVTLGDHGTDYLNTRAAVLHNHIHQQGQRLLVFVANAGGTTLQEVVISEIAELRKLCGKLFLNMLARWVATASSQECVRDRRDRRRSTTW